MEINEYIRWKPSLPSNISFTHFEFGGYLSSDRKWSQHVLGEYCAVNWPADVDI